jgi:squalene cyclase
MNTARAGLVIYNCGEMSLGRFLVDTIHDETVDKAAVVYAWTLLAETDENGELVRGQVSHDRLARTRAELVEALGFDPEKEGMEDIRSQVLSDLMKEDSEHL